MDDIDHFFSHLHFIGDNEFLFAVPLGTPEDLRARMFAAWKSFGQGLTSVDEILEKHRGAWHFDREDRTDLQVFVDGIVIPARDHAYNALQEWSGPGWSFDTMGRFAAGAALMRLQSSFTVLSLLTRFGFGFEGASVSRLILEQIAWAYAVRDHVDESLLDVSPTRSVGALKTLLPWAGHLYGRLSDYTHIDPALSGEYLSAHEGLNSVLLRRPTYWSPMLAWVFALLADAYVVVSEVLFPSAETTAIRIVNGKVEPVRERATAKLISQASQYALFDLETYGSKT